MAYLGGGARWDAPPLAWPWKFFTGDFIWKGAYFAIFQQELQNSTIFDGLLRFQISEKWANLWFPLNIQKQSVSASGGFGLCPWTPLGAPPPGPCYRLALHALAMAPLCQILNTPLFQSIVQNVLPYVLLLSSCVSRSVCAYYLFISMKCLRRCHLSNNGNSLN